MELNIEIEGTLPELEEKLRYIIKELKEGYTSGEGWDLTGEEESEDEDN
jgi:hypothetical protein